MPSPYPALLKLICSGHSGFDSRMAHLGTHSGMGHNPFRG